MKMCHDHWDRLRAAVEARGMTHLIAASGEKAAERIQQELAGQAPPDSFDPLMSANWSIFSMALKEGGIYLMGTDENGNQYCPLCEARKASVRLGWPHGDREDQVWIDGCMDSVLENARSIGMMPKV